MSFESVYISIKLALITTVLLLVFGLLYAYWRKWNRSKIHAILDVLFSLPIVLPSTVIGFYFLIFFGRNSIFGDSLVFSFSGLVLGSVIYSLPFMIGPITNAIDGFDRNQEKAAKLLGSSKWRISKELIFPQIRNSVITASILTFLHTLGEFGIVLMIGGSIPWKTKTVSIEIFEQVETMNYDQAHQFSLILIGIGLLGVVAIKLLGKEKLNPTNL